MRVDLTDEQAHIILRALEVQQSAARAIEASTETLSKIESARGAVLTAIGMDMWNEAKRAADINKAIDEHSR